MRDYLQRHEFIRHVLTLMTGTSLGQVIAMVSMLVVARLVSPTAWGIYSVITSVGGFLYPVAALRYDMAIVLPKEDADGYAMLSLARRINIVMCTVFALLLLAFGGQLAAWLGKGSNRWWLLTAALVAWSYAEVYILTCWSNRRKRFRASSTAQVSNSLVTAGLRIGAAAASLGPLGLVGATVAGEVAALGTFKRMDGLQRHEVPAGRRRELFREYKRMPLQLAPQAIIDQVRLVGIPLMLTHYFTYGTTGPYSMAWALVQTPIGFLAGALGQVFFQRLSQIEPGAMRPLVAKTTARMLAIGTVPFALIYFLAPIVLPWLMGESWRATGRMTTILVPWLWLNFVSSPVSSMFIVAKRQYISLVHSIFYAGVPLFVIWRWHASITVTLTIVSWAMAAMLAIYLVLALWAAGLFDRDKPAAPAAPAATA